jgi:hypothetical protein
MSRNTNCDPSRYKDLFVWVKKYLIPSKKYSTDCTSFFLASMVQRFLCWSFFLAGNAAVLVHALDLGLNWEVKKFQELSYQLPVRKKITAATHHQFTVRSDKYTAITTNSPYHSEDKYTSATTNSPYGWGGKIAMIPVSDFLAGFFVGVCYDGETTQEF